MKDTAKNRKWKEKFFKAIRKKPDDDGPRFVYGAWLERQGDPLGELIRLQCLINQIHVNGLATYRFQYSGDWWTRADELIEANQAEWAKQLGLEGIAAPGSLKFDRGFLRAFDVASLDVFFDHFKTINELFPKPEVVVLPERNCLHVNAAGEFVYFMKTIETETESGRVTYYSGTVMLTAYHIATRTPVCMWSRLYYSDDSDCPQNSGMISSTDFTDDGKGVVIKYQDGSQEAVRFGTFKI